MTKKVFNERGGEWQNVTAIVTAMKEDEKPFLFEAVAAIISDLFIGQIILCIEEKNDWLNAEIGTLLKDPRLQVIQMPMMPIGAVRNRALNYVQKPWVAYCDGDDVWCKEKTLIQQKYAYKTGADLIGAGHYLTDNLGRIYACGLSLFIPMPSSWMVRTKIMQHYPFNEEMQHGSDGDWWFRTSGLVRKEKCPRLLIRYRVRLHSVSSKTLSKKRKLRFMTISKIPILGSILYFLTYCFWLITRNQPYKWRTEWKEYFKKT
jgi:glycosyltransferase involved in cell wall biosynthesis